jgi:hypothetical protein
MTTRRIGLLLLAAALLGPGCGRLNDAGAGGGGVAPAGIDHPTGAGDLVLRWEYVGGFTSPQITLSRIPSFSLYGDGSLITEGPVAEIYPGPALPNLLVRRLPEDVVQRILAAARRAGLMQGNAAYPNPCVADAPETRFTVVADGRTSVVTAGALGIGAPGCGGSDAEATRRLSTFLEELGTLTTGFADEPYRPRGLEIFAGRYRRDPQLKEPAVAWPGSSLAAAGTPVDVVPGLRCSLVDARVLPAVLEAAASANQLTPWTSDGRRFSIVFRPLLPDERGC